MQRQLPLTSHRIAAQLLEQRTFVREIRSRCQQVQEQGSRSGESTRLPPMWPRIDSRIVRHMWVEFVGSLLCSERFFPGYSGFPLSSKTTFAGVAQLASARLSEQRGPQFDPR